MTRREQVIEIEVGKFSQKAQAEFRRVVANGNSMEFALMVVSRSAPVMGNCDRSFCEHQNDVMKREMNEDTRKLVLENAHRAGIKTEGKSYCGFIGKYDDPLAWVSNRDDAVTACKAKGISTDGTLKVKSVEKRKPERDGRFLAPDLVEDQMVRILQNEPKTREKFRRGKIRKQALKEMVLAEHGPPR